MKNDIAFTVRVDQRLYDLLMRTAHYEERSMGQIIRRAVRQYCAEMMEQAEQEQR